MVIDEHGEIRKLIKELEFQKSNYGQSKKVLYVESDIWNIYSHIITRIKDIPIAHSLDVDNFYKEEVL
jgi:hypothetical protein